MKKYLLIPLILFSIHFWGFVFIPQSFDNITNTVALLIMGLSFLKIFQKSGLKFKSAIILFFIGIAANIISANLNQGQPFIKTFIGFGPYYFILFYFTLHDIQPNRKFIENTIIIFAILYSLLYVVQILAYPREILSTNLAEDRGTLRIRIEGSGFLMLAYFLLLNRYFLNRKFTDIFLAFCFFTILVIGGFRTLTVAAILLSFFMFLKLSKYSTSRYAQLFFLLLLIFGLSQIPFTSNIFNQMIQTSIEQKNVGTNYIRILQLNYFFRIYPQNISYFFIGGGLPGYKTTYGIFMSEIELYNGFYWVDLGLLGFYIVVGAVTLLGLLWYSLKAIFTKLPPYNLYLSIYFLYLVMVSLTTMEIFRTGMFAVEAIGLYLIDIAINKDPGTIKNLPSKVIFT